MIQMSEKVLDENYVLIDHLFPEQFDKLSSHKNIKRIVEAIELHKNLVSVRLASESVDLKALKEWCEKNKFGYKPPRANIDELLKWAEQEAKK